MLKGGIDEEFDEDEEDVVDDDDDADEAGLSKLSTENKPFGLFILEIWLVDEFVEIDEEFESGDVGEVDEVPIETAAVPVIVAVFGYK